MRPRLRLRVRWRGISPPAPSSGRSCAGPPRRRQTRSRRWEARGDTPNRNLRPPPRHRAHGPNMKEVKSGELTVEPCVCCGVTYYTVGPTRYPFCERCLSGRCWRCASRVRELILGRHILMGRQPGPRMPCGWGCGAKLTNGQMRKHFTDCPRRPTVLQTMRKLPAKPNRGGRPPGPRMLCGWHCRTKLTATKMRQHFAHCPRRPKASAGGVFL